MPTPPFELKPPSPSLQRVLRGLWLAMLAVVLIGEAGGLWRAAVELDEVRAPFAGVGLDMSYDSEGLYIEKVSRAAARQGVAAKGWIVAIDDVELTAAQDEADMARLLAGPDGGVAEIAVQYPDGRMETYRLTRSPQQRTEMLTTFDRIVEMGPDGTLAALALIAAAGLLLWKRPEDPVSLILSFAFLGLAAWDSRHELFWSWVGPIVATGVVTTMMTMWIGLLLLVLPAFPDGRFVPSWSRWMLIGGPAIGLFYCFSDAADRISLAVVLAGAAVSLSALVIRYRRAGRGRERQQIKWVAFGLVTGLPLLCAAAAVDTLLSGEIGDALPAWTFLVGLLLRFLGKVMIALGLLLSLLQYRLNDADAAIGRSAGYAGLTLLIGAVWAITTTWVNGLIASTVGASGTAWAPGVSALAAAAVFAPANKRIMGWTESKFQRALVRLRGLPARLAKWQHGDDPEAVAAAALQAIVDGIDARQAALVGMGADGPRVLATHNVDPAAAAGAVRSDAPADEVEEPLFRLRIPLMDGAEQVGTLLLGQRSDSASYSRDERAAVAAIAAPLADTIRLTSRRAERHAAFAATLATLEARMARLEPLALVRGG